mmetsp:Transcript_16708/g.42807  ORF Transcript_16708/g.42807 Transcript_16708/m.42807 type:complete len:314 (+) Transcript_16708:384-1325(+)
MAVDVVNHVLVDARILDRKFHARRDTRSIRARVRHVVRVAVNGTAEVLGDDWCSAGHGVLEALHDEDTRTLSHDETVAVLIPRPGRQMRLVVARRECAACNETSESDGDDGCLRSSAHYEVGVSVADVRGGGVERVVGRRAGCGDGVVGTGESRVDGEQCTTHVCDGVWDEEGRDLLHTLRDEVRHSVLEHGETTHARADEHSAPVLVEFLERLVSDFDACGHHGFLSRDERVAEAVVHASVIFVIDDPLDVKVSDLRGKSRGERLRIEAVDGLHTRVTCEKVFVEFTRIGTKHTRNTHTCDDDTLRRIALCC